MVLGTRLHEVSLQSSDALPQTLGRLQRPVDLVCVAEPQRQFHLALHFTSDPMATLRKRAISFEDPRPAPSAMFELTETAARLIWATNPNLS